MDSYAEGLRQAISSRGAKVAVVGLGYVGLPLATEIAGAGFDVRGIERDPERTARINRGESYIADVPSERLRRVVEAGRLSAQESFQAVDGSDVVVICVPTPLDRNRNPDVQYIVNVMQQILPHVHAGQMVILESTSYPGTLEELVLSPVANAGHTVGEEVFLAFSSERIDPGNITYHLKDVPKVVGGVTPTCTELACLFYQMALGCVTHAVSSPSVAEMSKLIENTFRSVNVSLINELSQLCDRMGVDIWEAIGAAKTKPFGFTAFYPGPGVGGHCIPIDPVYLSWRAKQFGFTPRFIDLATEVNEGMPNYVVAQAMEALNTQGKAMKDSSVLVLGVAYKKDVSDVRESAALRVIELMQERGAKVQYHDSFVPEIRVGADRLRSVPLAPETLRSTDLVVITTDHSDVDYALVVRHAPLIYDTRNATRDFHGPNVWRLGAPPSTGVPEKHRQQIPAPAYAGSKSPRKQ
ncbi:MAG: nucleotide sugar dehydrogenase [Dehalococcoidia bacterium]|nr:nucleotide sugar dehydrogenase [Dehalococcoidia bacterium]